MKEPAGLGRIWSFGCGLRRLGGRTSYICNQPEVDIAAGAEGERIVEFLAGTYPRHWTSARVPDHIGHGHVEDLTLTWTAPLLAPKTPLGDAMREAPEGAT